MDQSGTGSHFLINYSHGHNDPQGWEIGLVAGDVTGQEGHAADLRMSADMEIGQWRYFEPAFTTIIEKTLVCEKCCCQRGPSSFPRHGQNLIRAQSHSPLALYVGNHIFPAAFIMFGFLKKHLAAGDEKLNLRVCQKSHLLTDILRNGDLAF